MLLSVNNITLQVVLKSSSTSLINLREHASAEYSNKLISFFLLHTSTLIYSYSNWQAFLPDFHSLIHLLNLFSLGTPKLFPLAAEISFYWLCRNCRCLFASSCNCNNVIICLLNKYIIFLLCHEILFVYL